MRVYVLPTREDQMEAESGRPPANWMTREWATEKEAQAYRDGLHQLPDLAQFKILSEDGRAIIYEVDGDRREASFATANEKEAFLAGLSDADGFVSPEAYGENTEVHALISRIENAPAPRKRP